MVGETENSEWPDFFMGRVEFYVDAITNSIVHVASGKSVDTEVKLMTEVDLRGILRRDGWKFNWKKEGQYPDREIYKLMVQNDNVVQGLLSLQIAENYIEMHLIETAPHNYGSAKIYTGAPGNLVAFACRKSFEMGFEGFVAFSAKTRLIKHYIDTLGAAVIFRDRMCIWGKSAIKIVNSYYKGYFSEE